MQQAQFNQTFIAADEFKSPPKKRPDNREFGPSSSQHVENSQGSEYIDDESQKYITISYEKLLTLLGR